MLPTKDLYAAIQIPRDTAEAETMLWPRTKSLAEDRTSASSYTSSFP